MMDETTDKQIVINDLLSFITCKANLVPREKLLNSISEYYSEDEIAEAQRTLLSVLPVKRSTRHGRRVKHPDPLVAIYDCIQLIPKEDLPIFVCKNLNNVPNLNTKKNIINKRNFEDQTNTEDENDDEMNEILCRKEQKLMRTQISEMFSIISELKDGLQKYINNQKIISTTEIMDNKSKKVYHYNKSEYNNNKLDSLLKSKKDESSQSLDQSNSDIDDNQTSKLNGLALLQKLIDEDDQSIEIDAVEKEDSYNSEDDPDNLYEFDEIENTNSDDCPQVEADVNKAPCKISNFSQHLQSSSDGNKFTIKNHSVVVKQSEIGPKVIYIKNSLGEKRQDITAVHNPQFSSDTERSIKISTTVDYINQVDKIGATSHSSHQDPNICGDEDLSLSPRIKTEELDADKLETFVRKESDYCCNYCMEIFTSYKKLRKHMNSHCVMKKVSYCVLCDEKFTDRNTLKNHFIVCFDKFKWKYKKNICLVCKTFYASDKALKQHKNLHEEFRPHSCPHCPYKYLNKATLDAHVKNQHSPLNKFVCPFCSHSAITNAYLSKHIKVHTGEAPFLCKTCGHKAKTKFLLKRHIELHGPLRERKCDKCSFVCVGLNEYLRHRRKQHGKPIVCQICRQTFKQSSTFIRHYNLHTQRKPYKCDRCLYTATVKETLRLHKLTHTGPNIQLCPECCIPCRNKRNLRRHLELYCSTLTKEKNKS